MDNPDLLAITRAPVLTHIYAAGDVAFPYMFTRIAESTARIAVQNALFLKIDSTYSYGLVSPSSGRR